MQRWLEKVRHDLVKHAAWRARDLRAALERGAPPRASDVSALQQALLGLPDAEGRPAGALAVWRALRDEIADPGVIDVAQHRALAPSLDRFESALSALVDRVASTPAEAGAVEPLCAAVMQ